MFPIGQATFYASGSKGREIRADGNGGYLVRGWYARKGDKIEGPFRSEYGAILAASGDSPPPVFKLKITRRNGVRALYPDGRWNSAEDARNYARKYIPSYQKAEVVEVAA